MVEITQQPQSPMVGTSINRRHVWTNTRLHCRHIMVGLLVVFALVNITSQLVQQFVNREWMTDNKANILPKDSNLLAFDESFGFFDDIRDDHWRMMQRKNNDVGIFLQPKNPNENSSDIPHWMINNVDPTFTCPHVQRVGGKADGPKWTCDPHRLIKKDSGDCLIYSIGSKGNYRFEDGIIDIIRQKKGSTDTSCEIHVFDPEPNYARPNDPKLNNIHYHAMGLVSSYNETMSIQFGGFAFKSLPEIIKMLGHEKRHIDIFKIDCEGCEFATYHDWLQADIGQILVEVHPHVIKARKWTSESVGQFFADFYKAGYAIFSKEANTSPYAKPLGTMFEFSFIKLKQSFHILDDTKRSV